MDPAENDADDMLLNGLEHEGDLVRRLMERIDFNGEISRQLAKFPPMQLRLTKHILAKNGL